MDWQIRKFQEKDISLYLEGEIASFQASYPGISINEQIKSEFKNSLLKNIELKNVACYTLEEIDPVAFVVIGSQHFLNAPVGYIENIYVKPDARRKGYGRVLLKQASTHLKNEGISSLELDVTAFQEEAKSLYESEGFSVIGFRMGKSIEP
jgi:ribosomal protein S18 acetylase RimI-like enzyme